MPRVVVTDDSNLHPAVLAELWPEAELQLCVFHIIKNINKLILDAVKLPKIMAYLSSPAGKRVRTNNHLEPANRMVRFFEKVRYKWGKRKTLVRFVVLKLNDTWSEWSVPDGQMTLKQAARAQRKTLRENGLQPGAA